MTGIIRRIPHRRGVLAVLLLLALGAPHLGRTQDLEPVFLTEARGRTREGRPQFESEHRPLPVRRYRLSPPVRNGSLEGFVRRPGGDVSPARIEKEEGGVTVSFNTPLGDGPMHGIHTLYVVDRRVEGNTLWVRTAKWHTVHHSCGWGHGYKYDKDRLRVPALDAVPLEISCRQFWDGNFHSRVESGDRLCFRVFRHGVPVAGAGVRLTSGRGWTQGKITGEDGTACFQLVRDYYPEGWENFDSRHRERFTVVAEYQIHQQGRLSGKDYSRIRYVSSIPWTYRPSRTEYTSSVLGLTIGFATIALGASGVYAYRERRSRPYREVRFDEKD